MCQDISQSIEIRASRFDQPNGRGLNDRHLRRDDHVQWWHLIAHGVAFCAAMGIAAIILFPYYPKIQDRTDTASDAFGAFLTLCVIFGGLGPLVTLGLFAAQRLVRRRSASQPRERTLAP
jgi:hypothetical protein